MSSFVKQVQSNGRMVWQLDLGFRLVKRWDFPRGEGDSGSLFRVRLVVGSAEPGSFFHSRSTSILLDKSIEDEFLFDTGAEATLISARIAKRLRLRLQGPIRIGLAGGGSSLGVESRVSVFLAGKWFVVPCIVPFPLDGSVPVDNLLGMGGILDGHLFCMAREELVLFRRPVATSGEEKNIA